MKMAENSPNGQKTQAMLVTSNFSFSHCFFQRLVLLTCKNQGLLWKENVNLSLSQTRLVFMCLQQKSFENTVGKGEIARNEQFLLFP